MSVLSPGDVSAAIARAKPGARIKLLPGVYPETLVVDRAVTIVSETPGAAVFSPPGEACAIHISADATLIGLAVECDGTKRNGVEVTAGAPVLRDFKCSGVTAGLIVENGARLRLETSHISRCGFGAKINSGGEIVGVGCVFDNASLFSALVERKARALFEETQFLSTHLGGLVLNEQAYGEFKACEWRNSPTAPRESRPFHAQLMLLAGAVARLTENCRLTSGGGAGVHSTQGQLFLSDAEITENADAGVQLDQGSVADIQRCRSQRNGGAGVIAKEGSRLSAFLLDASDNAAAGLALLGPAWAEVNQGRLANNLVGAVVTQGAQLKIADCDVSGNRDGAICGDGTGLTEALRLKE
jgi:hypothetical protein